MTHLNSTQLEVNISKHTTLDPFILWQCDHRLVTSQMVKQCCRTHAQHQQGAATRLKLPVAQRALALLADVVHVHVCKDQAAVSKVGCKAEVERADVDRQGPGLVGKHVMLPECTGQPPVIYPASQPSLQPATHPR